MPSAPTKSFYHICQTSDSCETHQESLHPQEKVLQCLQFSKYCLLCKHKIRCNASSIFSSFSSFTSLSSSSYSLSFPSSLSTSLLSLCFCSSLSYSSFSASTSFISSSRFLNIITFFFSNWFFFFSSFPSPPSSFPSSSSTPFSFFHLLPLLLLFSSCDITCVDFHPCYILFFPLLQVHILTIPIPVFFVKMTNADVEE